MKVIKCVGVSSLTSSLSFPANKESLVVDYNSLANYQEQSLAFFLPEAPFEMLEIFDEVNYIN